MRVYALYYITACLCVSHVLSAKLGDEKELEKRNDQSFYLDLEDTGSRIKITTPIPDMSEVSYCIWMKSTTNNDGTLMSYAVPNDANELLLLDYGNLKIYINDRYAETTGVAINDGICHHICFTWTSTTGHYKLYVDGVVVADGTKAQGVTLEGGGSLYLGQDQDIVDGHFSNFQAFIGQITQFNMWGRVLSAQEISAQLGNGDIYTWDFSTLSITGTVTQRFLDICDGGAVKCDPHFTTLDGRHYSHQGVCWYTLVKDCSNVKPDFKIIAKFEPREDNTSGEIKTRVVAINITVGDEYANVDRLDIVTGKTNSLSKSEIIQAVETEEKIILSFTLKNTVFKVDWTLRKHIFTIDISGSDYRGKLCGLLGNYNGDSHDDFQKPDGTIADNAIDFGESWKVLGTSC
ncbi:C-reactive protein-like [Saccoglossus kowalevskii]|uniref:Apolipophorins-like n=1 Tax=Saccoglossus kowalevskii TaxID=10224 RepID=A0A0U2UU33_SACKO|nr:PREDICTED: apolipophorins-like [Saccoglossus kowalevskii]ALR88631.1 pentaxin and von Willebrand type d domain containing protein-like 214 [Saccoglossus kowalevskii]